MRNKSNFALYFILFSLYLFLFSFNELSAQENGVFELKESNTSSKQTSKTLKGTDRDGFYNLTYKLHPTFYVENKNIMENNTNNIKVTKLTFNDLNSFDLLNQYNPKFDDVELITITLKTVGDFKNKLNLSSLSGFSNLKYIYVKCNFECTELQIKQFIEFDPNIRVFYKIEIPS
ncbi:hypothetical protein EV196_106246 [Mariniflexile fucanivorans]|uniref:Uncharacterized protein n=1 Tax=Mariniflexile fucanivorans TaxID=264023 RepID=A0A4R1RGD6_9FLAO|nr:hypothetical protein [Mariniflexile fucanivorans]TCL65054.1 hypothetical protein EV196_106246 [Mariniflexile fucanivorans]